MDLETFLPWVVEWASHGVKVRPWLIHSRILVRLGRTSEARAPLEAALRHIDQHPAPTELDAKRAAIRAALRKLSE